MTDRIQALMNQAYDRWQANEDWSRKEFLAQCSGIEYVAVIFGNMNYQVGNGGWSQWDYNEYSDEGSIQALKTHMRTMDTEASRRALAILNEVDDILEELLVDQIDEITESYEGDDDEEGNTYDGLHRRLSKLDTAYYGIDTQLMKDVEEYVKRLEGRG